MTSTIRCISPVDGSLYAERPLTPDAEVDAALAAAKAAQAEWSRLPIFERARYCNAAVDAMVAMRDEIVPELAWQMGRPVRYGAGELRGFEERARFMIDIADVALARIDPLPKENFRRWITREPLGIVFVVAPWNYPYLTAVNSVIPALMAGNAVILKHAAQTLLVGERFQRAFDAAGLPAGLFRNLVLSHAQTARIISAGLVDQVNFTGSVPGGKAIERAAAGTFTGLGLELGGKDPAYVRPDADMRAAIENLVDGAFFNSGQSCCGIERIYVHADVYQEFVDGAVELTRQYVLGNPLDPDTTLGPMVKAEAADFVRDQIEAAVRSGATAHIDPKAFPRDARGSPYMAPQVLTGVNHQMAVMVEESFGPVVGIMKVADDEEAIGLMNDSPYGLTASLWTSDLSTAEQIGQRLETGTVFMNRCDYLDPALAWTGVKDSGRGVTLSRIGYETLTRPKSWHMRTSFAS
ncbi:acyl-CoA reductase-like NAD-dependent aldehyde dehydrogenase [Tepidamorphus gemmatus]|jgi:acyl-CoA reductase-like NAD-dependent aldehyde dehydrogenase|uniref:Acyl-CoA reductase-like NAD-dependent aldehyde dehydrogenase n=1 Tax=Tepidamorphus gemmatus TaxID=747076 RepID=A0A4R3M786_9HYPH|nr:aldehyde dehydrogenase family protein [Tepidamorphus gemmatus]TCT09190.1 acyl-CoA reductase-like NAD-dependent aldehyde dehydrogenase [Tepidamorphus gemmatus]